MRLPTLKKWFPSWTQSRETTKHGRLTISSFFFLLFIIIKHWCYFSLVIIISFILHLYCCIALPSISFNTFCFLVDSGHTPFYCCYIISVYHNHFVIVSSTMGMSLKFQQRGLSLCTSQFGVCCSQANPDSPTQNLWAIAWLEAAQPTIPKRPTTKCKIINY